MMMDLRELYQEVIIDHNRHPRNQYTMPDATHQARGYNPLCGDKVTVYLRIKDKKIEAISFEGCGCAISQASSSLMTEAIEGKSVSEAHQLFDTFHELVTKDESNTPKTLDKLVVLAGVRAFPARVKCATLAWHTMESALKQDKTTVVTE